MLKLNQVSKWFGGLPALQDVSFGVQRGRITALIGPNGAGKSTLINCVSGVDRPGTGKILLEGRAIESLPAHDIAALDQLATYSIIRQDTDAAIAASADDHAFLSMGLFDLYEATQDPRYLRESERATSEMLDRVWDKSGGGFFFTPDDGESLLVRKKEVYDGAVPSANSVALLNLLRLGAATARPDEASRTRSAGARSVSGFSARMRRINARPPLPRCG